MQNRLNGTATLTFEGRTYQLIGFEAEDLARKVAECDDRIEIIEPLKWPQSFSIALDVSTEQMRKLWEMVEKVGLNAQLERHYPRPVAIARECRRRAQWKDEQSRYGRKL